MQPRTIEIRVRDAGELRVAWLDGLSDGGVFLPGNFSVGAGTPVLLRVVVERPTPTTTLLIGSVVWRRLPQREPVMGQSSITLRAGIGISLAPSMRARALFLDRLARGSAGEARGALRYPTDLPGELTVRTDERATAARVLDVSVRGARVSLSSQAFVQAGSAIEARIAVATSGEFARMPLRGRVAWIGERSDAAINRNSSQQVGVRLDLSTTDERLIWAKIVTRAREALEEQPIRVEKLTG
jgi:Tfp pilus assembly protein PilZ